MSSWMTYGYRSLHPSVYRARKLSGVFKGVAQ